MSVQKVDLLTSSGIIQYSDYAPQRVNITGTGNERKIEYIAYSGSAPAEVVGVQLEDDGGVVAVVPASFRLVLGDIVTFPAGTLTITTAAPVILSGIRYEALIRIRQAFVELMGESPVYAQQAFPEKEPFTALYSMTSKRQANAFHHDWEDSYHVYYYACEAKILIIQAGAGAQSLLEKFLYRMDSREGEFWQYKNSLVVTRSGDFENVTPIIDRLQFQEMAQVVVTLRFTHKHYEYENWIDSAAITAPGVVTLTLKIGDE